METIDSALTKIGLGRFHFISYSILGINVICYNFQIMIIPLLGLLLKCPWEMNDIDVYIFTTMSFVAVMVGCLIFGKPSDKYGRKKTLLFVNCGMIYFGIAIAFSPTFYWIIIMQLFTNIFTAGFLVTVYPLMSEIFPPKFRGMFSIGIQFFWAIGSMMIICLCFLVVPAFGWRVFMIISTIPYVLAPIALLWVPESPRTLLLHNDKIQCLAVINRIAKMNKSKEFFTDIHEIQSAQSSVYDLIHPNYLLTTILTCLISLISALSLYSLILLIPIINTLHHKCLQNMSTYSAMLKVSENRTIDDSCCMPISPFTFKDMFISSSAEFIFGIISLILINSIGRKSIISIYQVILIVGFFLLNFCLAPIQTSVILFAIRGAALGNVIQITVYATEIFPTSVKGLGVGISSLCGRVGTIISPFIVNIIIVKFSFLGGTMALCVINIVAIIACYLLPYETKNRKLYQTASQEDYDTENIKMYDSLK